MTQVYVQVINCISPTPQSIPSYSTPIYKKAEHGLIIVAPVSNHSLTNFAISFHLSMKFVLFMLL